MFLPSPITHHFSLQLIEAPKITRREPRLDDVRSHLQFVSIALLALSLLLFAPPSVSCLFRLQQLGPCKMVYIIGRSHLRILYSPA